MKKMRAFLLFLCMPLSVFAAKPEYNPDSKILSIPTVKVLNTHLYDAKLKLNDAVLLIF